MPFADDKNARRVGVKSPLNVENITDIIADRHLLGLRAVVQTFHKDNQSVHIPGRNRQMAMSLILFHGAVHRRSGGSCRRSSPQASSPLATLTSQ